MDTAVPRSLNGLDWARSGAPLGLASLVYVIRLIAHTADHVRRGTDVITPEVF